MHVHELERYFDYEPIFSEDPQFLVEEIKDLASQYLPVQARDEIQKTYEFTKNAHEQTKRLSGEPYIVHPLRATIFLMSMKPDLPTIQTCILHDVIEDTDITYEDVKKHFSEEVANLCEGLVKVSKVRYVGEERQLETLKKTFLAMGKDLRVIFVKLVDRIHNVQTLHFHPNEEKRRRIANETLKIYVPIAKRLGLFYYQQFLENGAFKILYPKEFERIFSYLKKMVGAHDTITQKGVDMIKDLLVEEHIPTVRIIGRIKSPYRIFEKMQHKYNSTADISKVTDLIAFRIVTDNIGNCYNILGVIHAHYIPLIKKIKDYIAIPKSNDYKSIHTTILGMFDFPVEIQIRTEEMDEIAEYGVAAHFGYTENHGSTTISERQAQWIRKLQDIVTAYTTELDKEKFKNDMNIELFDRNIFVYTQKGDVIELPEWSSVLDFAFRIHSDLGLRFNNANVNGSIVPISALLNTGDIVVINPFKNKYSASANWFEYLHTPSAKAKLTKFLKTKERKHLIERSTKLLDEKLKEYHLPALFAKDDRISKQYKNERLDQVLLQLLDKQFGYYTFIKRLYKDQLPESSPLLQQQKKKSQTTVYSPLAETVVVDGDMSIWYFLCPECRPTVGEKIIARSGKDGIKIHQMSCVALQSVSYNKLLEAHRAWQQAPVYKFSLKILCEDQPWVLLQLFESFSELRLNITWIHSEIHGQNQQYVYLTVDVNNPAKIYFLINELKKRLSSLKIVKKTLE